MANKVLILFLGLWTVAKGQHSPYSLQSAVDALHRKAQLALKDNYEQQQQQQQPLRYIDDDYMNDGEAELPPYRGSRQQLNKLLANYLARDEDDRDMGVDYAEEYDPEERKRSIFRERDELPYQSVFRERELDIPTDLTEDFLKEVDRQRNLERDEKYKETLRRLWEKYQQQESEIERELFDEEKRQNDEKYYKNRMYSNEMLPEQAYMGMGPVMAQKRILPVLPWLPASRKKRFPVSKRSPKFTNEDINVSGTNQKVTKDLQAIFGEPIEEKKKRSSDNLQSNIKLIGEHKIEKKSDHAHQEEPDDSDEHDEHEHEHDHGHEQEEDDEDDHDFGDSDEYEDNKKKRAIVKRRSNLEVVKEDQIIPGDLTNFKKKKVVEWSKYFGMDRRKKSAGSDWYMHKYKNIMKKPSGDYSLHNFKNHDEPINNNNNNNGKEISEEKLNNMDQKLKTIEDLIIDETVKYTGAHEGINNLEDIKKLKDHVVSRLATAYSLEKMRRALENLKQSVDDEQHLKKNEIESDKKDVDKEKRVAIKKEKAEFDNKNHKLESATEKVLQHEPDNGLFVEEEKKKKKNIKRNGNPNSSNDIDFEEELGAGHFEPLNEDYIEGKGLIEGGRECPLLDAMEKRCRSVDLLSGDIHQELLPVCGVHQLCYLCGAKQAACDFQYLSEADSICQSDTMCMQVARSALMILRDSKIQINLKNTCSKNPCIAMRLIGL